MRLAILTALMLSLSSTAAVAAAEEANKPLILRGTVLNQTAYNQDGTRVVLTEVKVADCKRCRTPLRVMLPVPVGGNAIQLGSAVVLQFPATSGALVKAHLTGKTSALRVLEGKVVAQQAARKAKKPARAVLAQR